MLGLLQLRSVVTFFVGEGVEAEASAQVEGCAEIYMCVEMRRASLYSRSFLLFAARRSFCCKVRRAPCTPATKGWCGHDDRTGRRKGSRVSRRCWYYSPAMQRQPWPVCESRVEVCMRRVCVVRRGEVHTFSKSFSMSSMTFCFALCSWGFVSGQGRPVMTTTGAQRTRHLGGLLLLPAGLVPPVAVVRCRVVPCGAVWCGPAK